MPAIQRESGFSVIKSIDLFIKLPTGRIMAKTATQAKIQTMG
jgi:hypothetical protein